MNSKEKYIELLTSTDREGVDELIKYLESTDFFEAPASAIYHNNYKGGLCEHSLNVYDNIMKFRAMFYPELDVKSATVVALLHDISKADYYEYYIKNVKKYSPDGRQSDSMGNFNWVQEGGYKIKDLVYRENLYGEHGLNSYMIASKYIKLSESEAVSIINHHMSLDNGKPRTEISEILTRFPLATLLCLADQASAYITENKYRYE